MKQVTCYGVTRGPDWTQEVYETSSRDAGRRARKLRKDGYKVVTSPMGYQTTGVGLVKLTMLTIDCREKPAPEPPDRVVRL